MSLYVRSDGSETLDQYKAAASKVSNPPTPSVVQGGSIGPSKAGAPAARQLLAYLPLTQQPLRQRLQPRLGVLV